MKVTTVSVVYGRKFNLGDYESVEVSTTLWAQVEEEEDADGVIRFLYQQAKESAREAAIPVVKDNEFQKAKIQSRKKQG